MQVLFLFLPCALPLLLVAADLQGRSLDLYENLGISQLRLQYDGWGLGKQPMTPIGVLSKDE